MVNGHMAAVLVSQDAGARKIPRRGEKHKDRSLEGSWEAKLNGAQGTPRCKATFCPVSDGSAWLQRQGRRTKQLKTKKASCPEETTLTSLEKISKRSEVRWILGECC